MAGGRPTEAPREPTPLGRRILEACEAERISQTALERRARLGQGYLSRLIYKPKNATLDVMKLEAMADILRVDFHWLATGRGTMRAESAKETPRALARQQARLWGCREDAIENVDAEHPASERDLSDYNYWWTLYQAEASRLKAAGTPEPHEVARKQRQVRATAKRAKKEWEKAREVPPAPLHEPTKTGTYGRKKG